MLKHQPRKKRLSEALSLDNLSKRANSIVSLIQRANQTSALHTAFEEALPERFKGRFTASEFSHSTLIICCDSASLATRFRMEQKAIITRLNQKLPASVSRIKIKIRPKSHQTNAPSEYHRTISSENAALLLQEADDTQDEKLKSALNKLARRAEEKTDSP